MFQEILRDLLLWRWWFWLFICWLNEHLFKLISVIVGFVTVIGILKDFIDLDNWFFLWTLWWFMWWIAKNFICVVVREINLDFRCSIDIPTAHTGSYRWRWFKCTWGIFFVEGIIILLLLLALLKMENRCVTRMWIDPHEITRFRSVGTFWSWKYYAV